MPDINDCPEEETQAISAAEAVPATAASVLGIADLEKVSGVPRTTIHAYVRLGLLPRPQKTATNRSLYTAEHLDILGEIAKCKSAGLSLKQIRLALEDRVRRANESAVNLAAEESKRLHDRILAVAAQEIASRGYRNTHVLALANKLGITTRVFYGHFPSKHRLLVECFTTIVRWNDKYVASKQALTDDPAERALWSLFANFRLQNLGAATMAEIRLEGTRPGGEVRKPIAAAWAAIARQIENALTDTSGEERQDTSVPAELIAYSLLGAYEETLLRASWDKKYSRADLLRAHLWLFLAIQAARTGRVDVDSEMSRYEELIRYFSSHMPPMPAPLET
jgi:DNA-binding transcriptional MerR regulator